MTLRRLPDSGRVCVVGFQPDQAAANTYYSVTVIAARAEVEPMAEPRNPANVLGVGSDDPGREGPGVRGLLRGLPRALRRRAQLQERPVRDG